MCGIAGVVGRDDGTTVVASMLAALHHRGPDHQAVWSGPGAALGHARLAIMDPSPAGHQPMANEDGQVLLVANGEIYNSAGLRADCERRGHAFRSRSDCEVLLHLYEDEGADFLPRLNGMFAVALWDARQRRLVLARDRLGIKPLYWREQDGWLAFASELKALDRLPGPGPCLDPVGLAQTLAYGNQFSARTLTRGVQMLRPGEVLEWQDGRSCRREYWTPTFTPDPGLDFPAAVGAWQQTAEAAVDRHLMSDVGVAAYLSSGFDSSTVASLAARRLPAGLATFTGVFGARGWYDEGPGAQAVATAIGAQHHEVCIGPDGFPAHFEAVVASLDEPRMGHGAFPQFLVARAAAAAGHKVILTGHGGDELWAGYPVFKLAALGSAGPLDFLRLAAGLRLAECPHLGYFLARRLTGPQPLPLPALLGPSLWRAALRPQVASILTDVDPAAEGAALLGEERDPYRRLTLAYLRLYLPGLFVVEDRISMAHALESRTPLCDNALVDLALSVPLATKLSGGILKAIPKAGMRGRLPDLLWRLPKRGFPTPIATWWRGPLRDWLRGRLLGADAALPTLVDGDWLTRQVEAYLRGPPLGLRILDEIPTHRMWLLLCLDGCLRRRNLGPP